MPKFNVCVTTVFYFIKKEEIVDYIENEIVCQRLPVFEIVVFEDDVNVQMTAEPEEEEMMDFEEDESESSDDDIQGTAGPLV